MSQEDHKHVEPQVPEDRHVSLGVEDRIENSGFRVGLGLRGAYALVVAWRSLPCKTQSLGFCVLVGVRDGGFDDFVLFRLPGPCFLIFSSQAADSNYGM